MLASLAKLQIDERLTAIRERDANLILAAFTAALSRAGLTPELDEQVRMDFASNLRALATTEAEDDDDDAVVGVVIPSPRAIR